MDAPSFTHDDDLMFEFRSQLPDDPESISELTRELSVHPHVQNVQRVSLDFGTRKSGDIASTSTSRRSSSSKCGSSHLRSLMRELGSLPNLRDLEFSNMGNGSSPNYSSTDHANSNHSYGGFPLEWLSFYCHQSQRHQHNRCVESLRLRQCTLTASPRTLQQFATSLQRLDHLKELELWDCQLEEETRIFGTLDGILQAAAQGLRQLQVLKLRATHCDRLGSLDASTIVELLQPQQHPSSSACQNLQELQLKGFSWDGAALTDILSAVQTHGTLQHLALDWCEFQDPTTAHALAKVITTNGTLTSMAIGTSTHYVWNAHAFMTILIDALKRNTTLKRFRLEHFDAQCKRQRGRVEQEQQLLGWTTAMGSAVLEMLESNVSIEELSLSTHLQNNSSDPTAVEWHQQTDVWLRLNRHGRSRYHGRSEQIGSNEWIDILADASADLDCVFYILQRHPFLLCR